MKSLFTLHVFLFFAFLLMALPVQATPVTKDTANTYYQNCTAQSDPRFSQKTQKLFCACTAVKLMENFTIEDMQATAKQDQAGRNATNKMITKIYAPCIRYPAREYHYQTCIQNPKSRMLGNAEKICNCSADQVATHLQGNAESMLTNILRKNPNVMDPMQALYSDPAFQKLVQSKVMSCVTR
jgi:hypothetical protein